MYKKINWKTDPFPHLIIDNFLPEDDFNQLNKELETTKNIVQRIFKTSLENKIILRDTLMKKNVLLMIIQNEVFQHLTYLSCTRQINKEILTTFFLLFVKRKPRKSEY